MSFIERLLVVAIRVAFVRHGGQIERMCMDVLRDIPADEWGLDLNVEVCQ
jgi:hypothetical protein